LDLGLNVCVLDGDNLRLGLNKDLDFSDSARAENVRRTIEVAKLTAEAGLVTLVALVSPSRSERAKARAIAGEFPFLEVFVDTPLPICEARDPKGLYAKARVGKVSQFTGISATYEIPEAPDLILQTTDRSIDASAVPLARRLLWLCRGMAGHLGEPVG
jgi:adenylyl-sulfate kinase